MNLLNLDKLKSSEFIGSNYIREPQYVSEQVLKYYKDKKILIYGVGLHTKEFLENVNLKDIVIGLIDENLDDDAYISFDFNQYTIFSPNELKYLDFDYLVLLGDWKKCSIESLCYRLDLKRSQLLLPYKDERIYNYLQKKYVQENRLELSKEKLNIALLIAFDRKDFISVCSDYLSKYFNLIKIYTKNLHNYDNKYFHQCFSLKDNIENVSLLINENNTPDLIIFWISSQYEFWQFYYIKQILPKNIKFILATSDLYFSVYKGETEELGSFIGMDKETSILNKEAEDFILNNADGIISNFTGEYLEKIRNKYNQNICFSKYFVNPRDYYFKENSYDLDDLHFCMAGSIEFAASEQNPIFTSSKLNKQFEVLLKEDFFLHIYSGKKLEHDDVGDYKKLKINYKKQFCWHGFIPADKLQKEMSDYHFGLVLVNSNDLVNKVYKQHFKILFQARIISYLAAGLPIIVSSEYELAVSFVREHKVGICIESNDFKNIKSILKNYDYNDLKNNVKRLQQKLKSSMDDENIRLFIEKTIFRVTYED